MADSPALEERKRQITALWREHCGRVEHGGRYSIPEQGLWAFLSALKPQWLWDDLARVVGGEAAEKLRGPRP